MAIYTYKCPTCQKVEDKLMKYSDPLPECTECKVAMEKQFHSNYKFIFTNKLCKGTYGGNLHQ